MKLTYKKLIKFNLMKEIEAEIFKEKKLHKITEFIEIVQEIQSIDQFIKESPSFPGSTDKIIREELVSGIGATLAIEGTTLKKEEIEESFRKATLKEKLERKEQEAENSRKVYYFIIELVQNNKDNFVYDEQIIKQIHKYFTDNIPYISNKPGDYRGDFPTTFGVPRQEGLCKTRLEIENAMSNFINWLNNNENVGPINKNPIIKAILAHYYLTEIHPFGDGNGRTARALEALVLFVNKINDYCFWSLANFWSLHRDPYLIHLRNIRNTCNPWDFLIWGLRGYLKEIRRIKKLGLKKVKQLMLIDYVKYLLANKKNETIKINQRIVDILSFLVKSGPFTLAEFTTSPIFVALYRIVSNATYYRDIKKMQELHLINIYKEEDKLYIEANFKKLDSIVYYMK